VRLTGYETAALVDCVQTWRYGADARQHGFFLAKKLRRGTDGEAKQLGFDACDVEQDPDTRLQPVTPGTPWQDLGYVWAVSSLASYEDGFLKAVEPEDRFVCFADPSTYVDHPGWMLRNLLVLIRQRWGLDSVRILCYRDVPSRRDEARSIILDLRVADDEPTAASLSPEIHSAKNMPKVTGWERNRTGKVTSRVANLGEYMDPLRYVSLSPT
jgi:ubiquitin-like modifier-activating enzyme ATG7